MFACCFSRSVFRCFTAILFGLIPATQFSRPDLQSTLKEGGRGSDGGIDASLDAQFFGRGRSGGGPGLLTGAGLLVRSFVSLMRVDPGFDKDRVVALQVFLSRKLSKGGTDHRLLRSIVGKNHAAVPGVQSAAVVASPPFINLEQAAPFTIQGQPPPPKGSEPSAFYTEVSPEYLSALTVPLRRGRFFTKFDTKDSRLVVVINQTMATRSFPNEDPVGKQLTVVFDQPETREMIGVIGDVLHSGLDSSARPEMFVPYWQSPTTQMTFLVKTTPDAAAMLPAVKSAIREVNPESDILENGDHGAAWLTIH